MRSLIARHRSWLWASFDTGDLARADDEGFLYITGRAGTEIRTGGEAVSPDRVEAAILTHPDIEAVTVIGYPTSNGAKLSGPQWFALVPSRSTNWSLTSDRTVPTL